MYLGGTSKGERNDRTGRRHAAERIFGIKDHRRMIAETKVGFLYD